MLTELENKIDVMQEEHRLMKDAMNEMMELFIELKQRQTATEELLIIRDVIAEGEIDAIVENIFIE